MRKSIIVFTTLFTICNANHTIFMHCKTENKNWTFVSGLACEGTSLFISEPSDFVNASTKVESNTIILDIYNEDVMYVPKGLDVLFPDLQALQIKDSKLKAVEQADIKNFTKLIELHLEGNKLEKLDSNLFLFNSELRFVDFKSNRLKVVGEDILKPLKKPEYALFRGNICIDEDAMGNIYIQNLSLSLKKECEPLNAIGRYEKKIESLNNLFELKVRSCNGNLEAATKRLFITKEKLETCQKSNANYLEFPNSKIDLICEVKSDNICNAVGLKVNADKEVVKKVLDESKKEIETHGIKELSIVFQQTLFLPNKLSQFFPHLTHIYVSSSGLFAISSNVFENMTSLRTLSLTDNKIYEILPDVFKDLENLFELDLSFNRIERVDNEAFRGLSKLQKLRLSNNYLAFFSGRIFESLKSIKEIFLNDNKLKSIGANFSPSFVQKIATANFSNNICIDMSYPTANFSDIEQTIVSKCIVPVNLNCHFSGHKVIVNNITIEKLYTCTALSLTIESLNTKISTLGGSHSAGYNSSNINEFAVKDQSIRFLPVALSDTFPNLLKIVVERSKLTAIKRSDFKGLTDLRAIIIRYNNLSSIDESTFADLTQLEHLDLSSNNIESLHPKIFSNLVNLKTLSLSDNYLAVISADLIPRKNFIEEFSAAGNKIWSMEENIMRYLLQANRVNLSGNICIDMSYDAADPKSKSLADLFTDAQVNCTQSMGSAMGGFPQNAVTVTEGPTIEASGR